MLASLKVVKISVLREVTPFLKSAHNLDFVYQTISIMEGWGLRMRLLNANLGCMIEGDGDHHHILCMITRVYYRTVDSGL